MLAGDNGASNTDPYAAKAEAGNHWIKTGPHVMVNAAPAAVVFQNQSTSCRLDGLASPTAPASIHLLIVLRFIWRVMHPVVPESYLPNWQRLSSELVHWLLYLAVLTTTLTVLRSDDRVARTTAWSWIILLGAMAFAIPARATDAPAVLPGQLVGNTLSAVAYVPRPAGATEGGALQRVMLQVYFAADGSTLLRQWVGARNSYTAPARTRWSLSENRLCIEMPPGSSGGSAKATICAVIHIWWPRIAGIGTQPYALLNGDLQPGNAIGVGLAR